MVYELDSDKLLLVDGSTLTETACDDRVLEQASNSFDSSLKSLPDGWEEAVSRSSGEVILRTSLSFALEMWENEHFTPVLHQNSAIFARTGLLPQPTDRRVEL